MWGKPASQNKPTRPARFNGAAARGPWNVLVAGDGLVDDVASMGPRPDGRGTVETAPDLANEWQRQ